MGTRKDSDQIGLGLERLHAEEIENAVLAAGMLDSNALREVAGFVRPEMFYQRDNQYMWMAVESLLKKNQEPDLLLVTKELSEMGKLEEVGGPYGVTKKTVGVLSSAHLWQHVYVMYEFYLRRCIVLCLAKRMSEAADLTEDVYDVLMGAIRDLGVLQQGSPLEDHLVDMKGLMEKTCERIKLRVSRSVDGVTGIASGVPELDRITGGWQPGNLIFTAGRPGMGKTQLGLKFAMKAAENGYKVLFFTLEMMGEELGERVLMMRAPELYGKVKDGHVTEQEVDSLCQVAEETEKCCLMVDDTPYVGIDRLCARANTVRARWGLDLIVVDYLQLLETPAKAGRNREQEVAECSRRLKGLARSLQCPVIVASQLNRQVEQTYNHRPELKHLRESGSIEQDADLVIMLYRNERGGSSKRCGLIVAKNRHGEISGADTCIETDLF